MVIELSETLNLTELMNEVDADFAKYGATNITCPVCGGRFVKTGGAASYTIRCETDDCVKEGFRGF